MFSLNKIFWLIVILFVVWYVFKFIEKKNKNMDKKSNENNSEEKKSEKKNLDAFKCNVCGLWVTESCNNEKCPTNL